MPKPRPHKHYTTGKPCNCTWAVHDIAPWEHDAALEDDDFERIMADYERRRAEEAKLSPEERRRVRMQRTIGGGWTQGTWGKGLYIPGHDPEVVSWNTGTRSLNGGSPHHAQVGRDYLGMTDADFHDRLRARELHLIQINPQGEAWECCFGHSLPDDYYAKSGFERPKPVERRNDLWS